MAFIFLCRRYSHAPAMTSAGAESRGGLTISCARGRATKATNDFAWQVEQRAAYVEGRKEGRREGRGALD